MPASSTSVENQRPRTPQHMPKLTYRNVTPNRASDFTPSAISSKSTSSLLASSSSLEADHGPNPNAFGLSTGYTCPNGSRTKPERAISSPETPTQAKKKNSSIFGFLRAKEPSTQAWLEYQDSLRKQQQAQHGRVSAVGMPMVSSAKLPPTVPKVNSKWDGVPENVAQREKERKAAERELRKAQAKLIMDAMTGGASVVNISLSRSVGRGKVAKSTQNSLTSLLDEPQGSCSSAASSRADLTWTPASIGESESSSIFGNALNSAPQTPLSDISAFMPSIPGATKLPHEPSKNPQALLSEVPEALKLTISPRTPAHKPLPLTPHQSLPLHASASTTPTANPRFPISDRHTTMPSLPPLEFVPLRSSGAKVLAPPMSAQRKAKASPVSAGDATEYQLPASQPSSILKKDATPYKMQAPPRPPLSAYFSSSQSSRNRSESTKDHSLAPGESSEDKPARLSREEAERSTTPTPRSTNGASRKGRMSFFKS